jgi:hypothetical protein
MNSKIFFDIFYCFDNYLDKIYFDSFLKLRAALAEHNQDYYINFF